MSTIEIAKYRLMLQPLEPPYLAEYTGSTFRGGFGHVSRRVACACDMETSVHQRSCLAAEEEDH